jgi:hypothetical protein
MSSRHDHRRRDRSWERDDRDKGRDRDRDRGRYSRRRSHSRSRSRSPRRAGTDSSRRPGMCHTSITPYFLSHKRAPPKSRIQTDVTTEEIGTRTGETGIPGTPVGAMTESDGTQLGGTGTRTGIGRTGRRGKARRVRMQNPSPSALENGVHG